MQLPAAIAAIDARSPVLRIRHLTGAQDRWHSCADLLAGTEAGTDPTARWRRELEESTQDQYLHPSPPGMSAAFILQWYCEILAVPGAFAAVETEWVLDLSPECVDFTTAPGFGYPTQVGLRAGRSRPRPDPQERLEQAGEGYRRHALAFARAYHPGVRMSSRQREGMVEDMWERAVESARAGHAGRGPRVLPRVSCCFIYALPGCQACAGCPREGCAQA